MKPALSPEIVTALARLATDLTGLPVKSIHVNQPRICDHCLDADREAFPYCVHGANGQLWQDLCNDCFDALGCAYPTD
jgi:hypothetical protein